eukprot:4532044-Alexandrium_andersonii.AAC.1
MAALAVMFSPDESLPCSAACSCNLGSPAGKPLAPAPEAHALRDLGREAHPAGWLSHELAP